MRTFSLFLCFSCGLLEEDITIACPRCGSTDYIKRNFQKEGVTTLKQAKVAYLEELKEERNKLAKTIERQALVFAASLEKLKEEEGF